MLHFLVDASLPKPTAGMIVAAGHLATDVRDIGMGTAPDSAIAAHARSGDFTLLSVDLDFANIIGLPGNRGDSSSGECDPCRCALDG